MPKRKLTFEQAQEIRLLYWDAGLTQQQLAKAFNVSQPTIHKIISIKAYKEPTNGKT
jgi:DNA-binding transcriptional regulator LsrR (DeoR family)